MALKPTLDAFRVEMAAYRRSADQAAASLKDPQVTLEKLSALYGKFDGDERQMADEVLAEWALSDDEAIRFDGLALINEFKILTAMPALKALATELASRCTPNAPYELKKVTRIISGLTN